MTNVSAFAPINADANFQLNRSKDLVNFWILLVRLLFLFHMVNICCSILPFQFNSVIFNGLHSNLDQFQIPRTTEDGSITAITQQKFIIYEHCIHLQR